MKKPKFAILILSCLYISGCWSLPSISNYSQLYSITKEKKKIKGGFSKKVILIKDFRENERYDEDIAALREKVEGYISSHSALSESVKNNLRELKVTAETSKEGVRLLLGEPDKVIQTGNQEYAASEIWIYRISKINAFTIVFVPIFFVHEGYYLYFRDDILTAIERHFLKQTFQSRGIAIYERRTKTQ